MNPDRQHPWDLTPAEAILLQKQIGRQMEMVPVPEPVELVGGADVSYVRRWNLAFAAMVIFRITERTPEHISLEQIETKTHTLEIAYPYIPGLLVFREGPALEAVWNQLDHRPDLLFFDGAGIGHPRRDGLAAHLGWRWEVPGIGCAKSRLIGTHDEVGLTKGSTVPLMDKRTRIGDVVRTRTRVKPLFVSPGYHCNFTGAVRWTLWTTTKYKLPEPTRIADRITKWMVARHREEVTAGQGNGSGQ